MRTDATLTVASTVNQIDIEQLLGTWEHKPTGQADNRRNVDQAIGQRIRKRRRELGWSMGKLGEALGVTYQQIQKYESGRNAVKASALPKLASALNVPLTWFFDVADPYAKGRKGRKI
ncbi:MAG: helix-turn-helix transcriptional regulator [Acetobacter sp.]|uniref:helix-turn-helix domain-containing protein n=1 Tax=Acetobacter sp. TaxID=440 RepID=UPI0039E9A41C